MKEKEEFFCPVDDGCEPCRCPFTKKGREQLETCIREMQSRHHVERAEILNRLNVTQNNLRDAQTLLRMYDRERPERS